jgi:3-deoxy-manno-octulosonate cytidylyltransferase (CMP-KDO synthetase)
MCYNDKNMTKIIAIIPARIDASRFPNKVLAPILGVPMLGHCYYRTRMCKAFDEVYIATCDEVVREYGESIGAKVIMTKNTHTRAMDRTAEAVQKIEQETGEPVDIVVQMQGDEPMIQPDVLSSAISKIVAEPSINIMNLVQRITDPRDLEIPDVLKVVTDLQGNMLYYSRSTIPYDTKKYDKEVPYIKTLGVHLFRKDFLFKFLEMAPTPLEIIESTDMLRILENGYKIATLMVEQEMSSVDTPDDLRIVEEKMKDDPLLATYVKDK